MNEEIDPNNASIALPTSAIFITNLQWWTSDVDLVNLATQIGQNDRIKNVFFMEHRTNAKSRGMAYLEFDSPESAAAMKAHLEHVGVIEGKQIGVYFTHQQQIGQTPFKFPPKDSAGVPLPLPGPIPQYQFQQQQQQQQQQGGPPMGRYQQKGQFNQQQSTRY